MSERCGAARDCGDTSDRTGDRTGQDKAARLFPMQSMRSSLGVENYRLVRLRFMLKPRVPYRYRSCDPFNPFGCARPTDVCLLCRWYGLQQIIGVRTQETHDLI